VGRVPERDHLIQRLRMLPIISLLPHTSSLGGIRIDTEAILPLVSVQNSIDQTVN
jgi:hypothetical protein